MKKLIFGGISLLILSAFFISNISSHLGFPNRQKTQEVKAIHVPELNSDIIIFNTVWTPQYENNVIRRVLKNNDLSWAKKVLDVGTGSGILGLIALKQGAGRVIATDINPAAVRNARYNAASLGFNNVYEARLVPKNNPTAFSVIDSQEKFDLIISDPPWDDGKVSKVADYAKIDKNRILLKSFIENLKSHLTENGKAWLYVGNKTAIAFVSELVPQCGLEAVVIDQFSDEHRTRVVFELK